MKRFRIFQFSLYAVFFITVYLLSFLIGKTLELTLILISYFLLRYTFAKTWHASTTLKCIVSSIITFWVAETFALPIEISILCSVIFGFLISYGLYLIQDYLDIRIPPKPFENLTEETLDKLVKKYNLSELARNRLRMRYINKLNNRQIAEIENVELEAIEEYFRRLKKRFK